MIVAGTVIGSVAVSGFTRAGNQPQFYQAQFGPAALWVCGRGFVNPPTPSMVLEGTPGYLQSNSPAPGFEAFSAFLAQQRDSFDCGELPSSFAAEPLMLFQGAERYLLMLAAMVWSVSGVSWSALNVIGPILGGVTAGCIYLLARTAMGPVLAVSIAALWITSPLQLSQMPHLRDYAKAPFFMFTVCGIAWIALTRASRRTTVVALALLGAVIGFGFGLRTDVATYLPFILIAVLMFRPGFARADLVTRGLAAAAGIVGFLIAAWPIIQVYQTGDNLGHVAILGMSDPSRDWLGLQQVPYSFGYLYHDGYMETVLAAHSERLTTLTRPLQLGTPDYAKWGNEYYSTLVATFPGDILVRAWAAVLAVCHLPFDQVNVIRPPWIDPAFNPIFEYRGTVLSWLERLSPVAVVAMLAIGIATASVRLGLVFMLFAAIMPGLTSVQYQLRHVFQFEVVSLFAYGCLLHFIWRLVKHRKLLQLSLVRGTVIRGALVTAALTVLVVAPISAARTYQNSTVSKLFSAYE